MTKDYKIVARINAIHVKLPIYRIWLDEELMCERTFWPNPQHFYIDETMVVGLDRDKEYLFRFELVDPKLGKAWCDKVTIYDDEDNLLTDHGPSRLVSNLQELVFKI